MKRWSYLLLIAIISIFLAACSPNEEADSLSQKAATESAPKGTTEISNVQGEQGSSRSTERTLFVGMGDSFQEYPQAFDDAPTPDTLIQAIAELTGWNLTLAEPVSVGKDGVTVVFSKDSAIYTGPPEPQKEEFHVYDSYDLVCHILDSIQKTLQTNLTEPSLVDSADLAVYFAAEGNQPISLPDAGIEIPMDAPYSGSK